MKGPREILDRGLEVADVDMGHAAVEVGRVVRARIDDLREVGDRLVVVTGEETGPGQGAAGR